MKHQGVIFDLDGVICHTDHYHYLAWKALADSLGIYFDESINNRLRGVSRMESLEIILERYEGPALSAAQKDEYAARKNELYRKSLLKMSPADLSAEVYVTLESLRARGLKLAIGSSSKNAPLILTQIGLNNYFDGVSDGNSISHSKPDPEVFLKAAGLLQLPPSQCLVVEDALAGLQAAKAGGMDSAGIGDAASSELGTYHLDCFSQLLNIFG